jgi:hypothetical protein
MKRLIPILSAAVMTAAVACGPKGAGTVPVVDVTKSYPKKDIVLQDVAGVEYLPLETREGFLLGHLIVAYMDDEVIVTHNREDIMFFDRRTGKGIRSFNRKGRGPGEYTGIDELAVDMSAGELFVTPNSLSSGVDYAIYVYDLEGRTLRTLKFSGVQFPRHFTDYDAEHLFYYSTNASQAEPYRLLSKRDTVVTRLPVRFEGRESMMLRHNMEGGGIMGRTSGTPIVKAADGHMLSEPGTDTVFHLSRAGRLTPVVAQTPSFRSMEFPIGLFWAGESRDYMFLQTIERKYDWETNRGFETVNLIYDKASGELFEGRLVNEDFDNRMFPLMNSISAGTFVFGVQPFELLELHEAGKLRGRLAEIAPTLKEDDNPVMMIVKFK